MQGFLDMHSRGRPPWMFLHVLEIANCCGLVGFQFCKPPIKLGFERLSEQGVDTIVVTIILIIIIITNTSGLHVTHTCAVDYFVLTNTTYSGMARKQTRMAVAVQNLSNVGPEQCCTS